MTLRELIAERDRAWNAVVAFGYMTDTPEAKALRVAFNQANNRVRNHPVTEAMRDCRDDMNDAHVCELFAAVEAESAIARERDAAVAANERMKDALDQIAQWASAYPETVFRPVTPDQMQRAATVLRDAGISMDAMHAEWARHIVSGIQGIVRAALGKEA